MHLVEQWLKGPRNFYVGKAIYSSFGKDKPLLDLLSKGKSAFAEQALLKAMQALTEQPKTAHIPQQIIETGEMPAGNNAVEESIRQEWLKPYQEMNYKRHQLDQYKGNKPDIIASRKTLAFEILELEQQCIKIWAKRDHYLQNGKLPDVFQQEKELPTDPLELGKLIESIKKNIRRNRKLMQDHPDKPVYAQKYNHYKDEYAHATGKPYEEKD